MQGQRAYNRAEFLASHSAQKVSDLCQSSKHLYDLENWGVTTGQVYLNLTFLKANFAWIQKSLKMLTE